MPETRCDQDIAVGDFLSATRLVVGFAAASVLAIAGQGAQRTAIDNARSALVDARRRAQERREVDAVFAAIARVSRPPFRPDEPPVRTAVR